MVENRLSGKSMEQRITDRLKNSGDAKNADVVVQKGEGPTRAFTNIHHGGTARRHGEGNRGEPGVDGKMRGPAAPLIGQLEQKS